MVSSIWSGTGQMQTTPAICRASPPPPPILFNRIHMPIEVQMTWYGWTDDLFIFNASHRFTIFWDPVNKHYTGHSPFVYPVSACTVHTLYDPLEGNILCDCNWQHLEWYTHRYLRPDPPDFEPWTPTGEHFWASGGPYLGVLTGEVWLWRP